MADPRSFEELLLCPIHPDMIPLLSASTLNCGHTFSKEGLAQLGTKCCPICRTPFTTEPPTAYLVQDLALAYQKDDLALKRREAELNEREKALNEREMTLEVRRHGFTSFTLSQTLFAMKSKAYSDLFFVFPRYLKQFILIYFPPINNKIRLETALILRESKEVADILERIKIAFRHNHLDILLSQERPDPPQIHAWLRMRIQLLDEATAVLEPALEHLYAKTQDETTQDRQHLLEEMHILVQLLSRSFPKCKAAMLNLMQNHPDHFFMQENMSLKKEDRIAGNLEEIAAIFANLGQRIDKAWEYIQFPEHPHSDVIYKQLRELFWRPIFRMKDSQGDISNRYIPAYTKRSFAVLEEKQEELQIYIEKLMNVLLEADALEESLTPEESVTHLPALKRAHEFVAYLKMQQEELKVIIATYIIYSESEILPTRSEMSCVFTP